MSTHPPHDHPPHPPRDHPTKAKPADVETDDSEGDGTKKKTKKKKKKKGVDPAKNFKDDPSIKKTSQGLSITKAARFARWRVRAAAEAETLFKLN